MPVMHRLAATLIGLGFAISACTTFSGLTLGADDPNVVNPNGKSTGSACTTNDDCQSGDCSGGKCSALTSASSTNGKKDGRETDVDCGGGTAPQCDDGKACEGATDCTNGVCKANACASPAPDDGIKNGDETDVDCGGTKAPKCATDKACAADGDCTGGVCSYAKKCLADTAKSCAQHFGGDTCGAGETGTPEAKHESCCTTVQASNGLTYGKYQITAGRMRAFATKFNGNLRSFVETNPPNWDDSFNDQMPSSMDEVDGSLGPNTKRGCSTANKGARTWWQEDISATERNYFPKDTLDEKSLNCVPWYLALALCVYDGGRLPTASEVQAGITNSGQTQWPWEFQDRTPYNEPSTAGDPRVVHHYSYATPTTGDATKGGDGLYNDRSFYIAPPGRRPTGANMAGVMDAVGNNMVWVADAYNRFYYSLSWEDHDLQNGAKPWADNASERDGYYAIGARCVFDK